MQSPPIPLLTTPLRTSRSILLGAIMAATAVVLGATLLVAAHLRQQAQLRIEVTTQNLVHSIEQYIFEAVESVDVALLNTADEMSRQLALGAMDSKSTSEYIQRQLQRQSRLAYIRATNEQGDVVYGPGVLSPPVNIKDRAYFSRLRNDPRRDLLTGQVVLGRIDNQWVWIYARRISKTDGSFAGVVFAGIRINTLNDDFSKYQLDTGGSIALRDAELGLITRYVVGPGSPVEPGDKRLSEPFARALKANNNGNTYVSGDTSIDGISRTHSYRRNAKYGFVVNVGLSGDAELALWKRQAQVGTLMAAFILAALAFAWMLRKSWRNHEESLASILASQQALTQSEAKIKGVLEGAADAIFISDQKGNFQYVNDQASTMLGYSPDALLQMTAIDFIPGEELPNMLMQFRQLVSTGSLRAELQLRRKDAQVFPVDFNGTVLPDGSVFGSCRDISERKKTEKALRESEAHLKAIIETEPECIKILDAQGLLLQMNPAGLEMIEADSFAQVKGTPVLDIVAPEYRDAFAAMHKRVIGGEAMHMEYEVLGLKGGRRLLETHAVPMNEQGQTVHLAVTRDITRRKQMEDQVRQLAFHDPLTNLPNRRLLLDRLAQAMAASKRSGLYCAVMFLDLDKFKILNDTHGHGAGDSLLLAVTDRLKNCVREVDTVSRFGGDEFVVLLNCLTADRAESTAQAAIVAEKIRVTLQEPYMLSIEREGRVDAQVDYHCTVSIGVAIFINHEASPEDILKWADAAMYKAKDAGRNTVQFHESPAP
jgi:diguanylate cyclase (GGDEF)-like protein/PAS domain S-box-containing protein